MAPLAGLAVRELGLYCFMCDGEHFLCEILKEKAEFISLDFYVNGSIFVCMGFHFTSLSRFGF